MDPHAGGVTPQKMFERQEQKRRVLQELVDALDLVAGDQVLDVGSGPGYASLLAAERVGPTGAVWALDQSPPLLAYLQERSRGRNWLRVVAADAAAFALPSPGVRRFLLTDVLHDAEEARAILSHLARVLPSGARGVVSDYLPVERKRFGPDPEKRIPEGSVRAWLIGEGFTILKHWYPPDEHYAFLVEVRGGGGGPHGTGV